MTSLTEGVTRGAQGSISVECLPGIRHELGSPDSLFEFGLGQPVEPSDFLGIGLNWCCDRAIAQEFEHEVGGSVGSKLLRQRPGCGFPVQLANVDGSAEGSRRVR
jgi:hypothetical protein